MIINHIKMLVLSIRNLGIVTGIKYFRSYLRALEDPNFILEWAGSCEKHARKLEFFDPHDPVAEAARHWAETLRECNRQIVEHERQIDEQ
jgi:hypothetical protein